MRGRGLVAHRAGHRQRHRHRQLHDPRAVHVRARRAPVLLLLVQGAAEPRPGLFRLSRGLPRRRPLPHARLELQLHHVQGLERRVLLRQPVHRLRPLLQADGRHRAAPRADLPGQPGGRCGHGPRGHAPDRSPARRWRTSSGRARSTPSSGPSRRA